MRGILWGWLFALGVIFWTIMAGLHHYLALSKENSLPEPVVPTVNLQIGNYITKEFCFHVLALIVVTGLGIFTRRRFSKKPAVKTESKKKIDADVKENPAKLLKIKDLLKKNVPDIVEDIQSTVKADKTPKEASKDTESQILAPSVNVRELQAKLREFEDNLAVLKRKGERLMKYSDVQQRQWTEL